MFAEPRDRKHVLVATVESRSIQDEFLCPIGGVQFSLTDEADLKV
jgi:hypothetical protein